VTILVAPPRYAPEPGGVEILLAQLLPELRADGFDLVVVTGTSSDSTSVEVVDGVVVYRFPFTQAVLSGRPARILALASQLRDVEDEHGVTVRHVHGIGDLGPWFVWRAHQRRPCPLGVSVHGTIDTGDAIASTATSIVRAADVVTVVSDAVRASVTNLVRDLDRPIRLIPNGLRGDPRPPARRPADGPLLAVGRLEEQKGFDVAIEALARLQPVHAAVQLVVVGRGSQRAALQERAARAGVGPRVEFVDHLAADEIRSAMRAASVVLVPSRSMEGFSLVALEAGWSGRPVIASSVGGLPETVRDGVTGIVVPPDDPGALAAAIERLLGDPASATAMGRAGWRRARDKFDFGACLAGYRELYRDLLADAAADTTLEPEPSGI